MIGQFVLLLIILTCGACEEDASCVTLPEDSSHSHSRLTVRCCPNETRYLVDDQVVSVTKAVEARCVQYLAANRLTATPQSNTALLACGFVGTFVVGIICGGVGLRVFQMFQLRRALRPSQGFPLHRWSIWRAQRRAFHARAGRPASPVRVPPRTPRTPQNSTIVGSRGLVSVVPITQLVAPLPELSVESSQGVVRHSLRTLLSLDDAAVYEHGTDTLDSNYGYEVFESTNPFATVRLVVEEPVYDSVEYHPVASAAPPACPPPSPAEEALGAVGGSADFVDIAL